MNAIPEHGQFVPLYPDRKAGRHSVSAPARLLDSFFRGVRVRLVNLSAGGFQAEGESALWPGDLVWIDLPGIGMVRSQVRWKNGDGFGAAFLAERDLRLKFLSGIRR